MLSILMCARAGVCVCVCWIVSTDKILHFTNTLLFKKKKKKKKKLNFDIEYSDPVFSQDTPVQIIMMTIRFTLVN